MRKIGISSFVWVSPFHMHTLDQLAHAKSIGFDIYEIAVEDPGAIEIEKVYEEAQRAGIQLTICGAFGETRDISHPLCANREGGMAYIRTLIDMAYACKSPYVAGPMYASVGRVRQASHREKREQFSYAVENLKRVSEYAAKRNVALALEPLNRFETDFINTVEQGLELLEKVGFDNAGFLLDTFHMNIEEKSLPHAIRMAKGKIFNFHACANDRGTPGEDHFDWQAIAAALDCAAYKGPVVIESFTPSIKEIAKAVSLWRPLAKSPDELARNGLTFLRGVF